MKVNDYKKIFKKRYILGVVNDQKHLALVDYNNIDPEKDMTHCVINLKIDHSKDKMVTKKMIEIEKTLLSYLSPNDICPNRGQKFQIRVNKKEINKIIKIIINLVQEKNYSYQMFIGNYVMNDLDPVGQFMDDGLSEAGMLSDLYWKFTKNNFIIGYDRKSKLKIFFKLDTYNYKRVNE